jgi:hypothetical protein
LEFFFCLTDEGEVMNYDPKVIVEFAARLYARANSVILTYTVLGILVGLGAGAALVHGGGVGAIVGGAILGAVGYSMGSERAFQYKLQAQTALCQVQIETNTRTAA